uniref:Anoctamin-like protein At1g73020 n=1 Tax=Nicotiana tabacum TaxID=4097 RepID=A0A1S3ZGM4_TOBAC
MNGNGVEEETAFEIGVVVPKSSDCIEVLVEEFRKAGLIVDRVVGLQNEFIRLGAPIETLGKAAAELQLKKRTHIGDNHEIFLQLLLNSEHTILVSGVDLQFHWDEVEAFERQPDGSLFSWFERYCCYRHIIYGIVNTSTSTVVLKSDGIEVHWEPGKPLLRILESVGIVKEVFPVHDEKKTKQLLRSWALNWWDFTVQPIDDICNYYGTKIASYFAFLGMYTKWILFPAAFGLTVQLVDFGSLQLFVLSAFFISIVSWAVLFLQFWKRKNSALLVRWQMNYPAGVDNGSRLLEGE